MEELSKYLESALVAIRRMDELRELLFDREFQQDYGLSDDEVGRYWNDVTQAFKRLLDGN